MDLQAGYESIHDIQLPELETDDPSFGTLKPESDLKPKEAESASWFYNSGIFLPGKLTAIMIFSTFPFVALGRFLPVLDFASDVGSAGNSFLLLQYILHF